MRQIDLLTVQRHNIPSFQLMESAARACYDALSDHFLNNLQGRKALILCGPGNNGGDGAALAQELAVSGVDTTVVIFGRVEKTQGDARANFETVQQIAAGDAASRLQLVECDALLWEELVKRRDEYDFIVDGLFGTGLSRPLEGALVSAVEYMLRIRAERDESSNILPVLLSIDVPLD